jgi:lysyl-tRNA synthetase class 2
VVKGVSTRFELFIGGKEIVNAYSEQNDPQEQRRRFTLQAKVNF